MRKKLKNTFIPHKGNGHTPHLLGKKALLVTIAFVGIVELSIYAGAVLLPRLSVQFAAVLPSAVTILTNELRAESLLPELAVSDDITRAAQAKADDMALKGYFAHVSPDGSQPWHWLDRAGYSYEYAGENLAVNFVDSEELVEAWRNSPTHNLNLIGPRYTETGVGTAKGMYKGKEAVFVVQMFASPKVVVQAPAVPATPPVSRAEAEQAPESASVLGTAIAEASEHEGATKAVASPKTYGRYIYLALAGLFALILLIGFTPVVKGRHHPRAVVNGVLIVGMIAGLIFLNEKVVFNPLELPSDSENSATVMQAL